MNGIEKITARIEQEAHAEIAELLQQAEREAESIRAAYAAEAAAAAEKATAERRKAAAQRGERLESAAQMEARKEILAAKQACIEKAFALSQQKLLSLPEEEYVELLAKMAVRASKTGQEEVVLNTRDRAVIGGKVVAQANAIIGGGHLTLSDETREMEGGLILKDGKIEINCAFETRLRILRENMAAQVARILFP